MTLKIEPIVVEEFYPVNARRVWEAITDPIHMSQWYFEPIESFEPVVGFETEFTIHVEGVDYVHQWRVLDVNPGQSVAYRFDFEGVDGDVVVRWELSPTEAGTTLTLIETGWETLPQDNPLFTKEAAVAGWTYLLKESLKKFLDR